MFGHISADFPWEGKKIKIASWMRAFVSEAAGNISPSSEIPLSTRCFKKSIHTLLPIPELNLEILQFKLKFKRNVMQVKTTRTMQEWHGGRGGG